MFRTLQRVTVALCVPVLLLPAGASAAEQLIELSSSGREAKYTLPAGTREVELVTQRTGSCRLGRTWGYDLSSRELWVNGGCGGQFKIITHEAASAAPDSSNTAAALAAAAAIAGVAILASKGRHDHSNTNYQQQQPYYPPANNPNYYPPSSGYHPPTAGYYPPGGGRQGTIHGPGGMCLDMLGDRVQQGTGAILYACHGKGNQRFNWTPRGELIVENMCLDIAGGSNANGARVIAWPCNGGRNQQWFVSGSQIQSQQNGKCLDVEGGSIRSGSPVNVYDCHGGPNQRWFW
jgi:hypothetical protein